MGTVQVSVLDPLSPSLTFLEAERELDRVRTCTSLSKRGVGVLFSVSAF